MKAVRYHGPNQTFRLEDVPEPALRDDEVLVRIHSAGMCHTELHFESGLLNLGVAPIIMGHEIAGTIEATGATARDRKKGERVLVYYYAGCGTCEWCRRGDENLCGNLRAEYGFFQDGGYAEVIAVPARNAIPLPESLSFDEAAPIGCAVATGVHAANLAHLREGDVAVVYGIGAVGFGLVQIAKLRGAKVFGVGRTDEKLDVARSLGADHVINSADTRDVAAVVRQLTGGRGADVVFDLVGTSATMSSAVAMVAKRGRIIFIGYSEDPFTVHPIQLVITEATVTGSVGNTRAELEEAVALVGDGRVKTIVDSTLPLNRWEDGLESLRAGKVKGRVILHPQE
ncbi:MAG: zinc-binding dehydrogenase [Thermoanaerobaculia bacterium]